VVCVGEDVSTESALASYKYSKKDLSTGYPVVCVKDHLTPGSQVLWFTLVLQRQTELQVSLQQPAPTVGIPIY